MLILAGTLVSACSTGANQLTPTDTIGLDGTLRPYPSDTATVTPLPTDYVSPTPSPTITPTPTNVYYEVQANDDMGGIAYYYGISVADLMTANPDIDPRAMTVGMQLLIPITPTPPPTAAPTSEDAQTTSAPTEEAVIPAALIVIWTRWVGCGALFCMKIIPRERWKTSRQSSPLVRAKVLCRKRLSCRSTCCLRVRHCP